MTLPIFVSIVISLTIAVGCADLNLDLPGSNSSSDTQGESPQGTSPQGLSPGQDDASVTAQHLVDELADNPLRFEMQYLNLRVRVSGKVKEIRNTSLILATKGGDGLRVILYDLAATDIIPLNVGDRVTADCVVGSKTIWGVIPLNKCQMK